jgi:phosphohistidine swiveling domain-containing protein
MKKLNPLNWKESFTWEFEAYPFFTSGYNEAANSKVKNKYYVRIPDLLNGFEGERVLEFVPKKRFLQIGNNVIKEALLGKRSYLSELKKVHKEMDGAIAACLKARSINSNSLSGWWSQTQKALSKAPSLLFPFDFTFDGFINQLREKNPEDFTIINSYIENNRLSFMDEGAKYLLELNVKYGNDFDKVFTGFVKKFGWFQNSYKGVFVINKQWLKKYLQSIKKNKKVKQPVKQIRQPLPKQYKIIVELINEAIIFRDDKKKLLLLSIDLLDNWLQAQCAKYKWNYEELRWLTVAEIIEITKKRKLINLESAKKYNQAKRRLGLMVSTGYKDFDEKFWQNVLRLHEAADNINSIKGVVASKGVCRGEVKVILDAKGDAGKFKKGNILVTSMTRPEFLPLMNKAAAFITDEGGISCHAAIVAREMNKPCIIATRNATRILKDGDLVEVDANNGVVKIINN